MHTFSYVIKDAEGIHARPAGLFVKAIKGFESNCTIQKGAKSVDAKKLFALMSLAAKQGEEIGFTAEGSDAELACQTAKAFLEENL